MSQLWNSIRYYLGWLLLQIAKYPAQIVHMAPKCFKTRDGSRINKIIIKYDHAPEEIK